MPSANDTYRKTYEPPSMRAETGVDPRQEESHLRQKQSEGYKLTGLVMVAGGIGAGAFLYLREPDSSDYLVGIVPFAVGLAFILYGLVLAPRSSTGSRS